MDFASQLTSLQVLFSTVFQTFRSTLAYLTCSLERAAVVMISVIFYGVTKVNLQNKQQITF